MKLDADLLAAARYDDRGVPVDGRDAEFAALRTAGVRDLSAARIFEGHLNGLGLVARFGTSAQRAAARLDARTGRLFGVWNTQDDGGVRMTRDGDDVHLAGAKTWASGARFIQRPIVTATLPDGRSQMLVVPFDEISARIDASGWRPLGMHASESVRVSFDGITLGASQLLGHPGDYQRDPWFSGGALRFVAVQSGALQRLVDETLRYLIDRSRDGDPMQTARVAEMQVGLQTAQLWIEHGIEAWKSFDDTPDSENAARAVDRADGARVAVERAAFDLLERAMKAIGARGLIEPLPFAGLVRDLEMYLRQPAPDAILQRVGRTAFAAARSARIVGNAASTATGA